MVLHIWIWKRNVERILLFELGMTHKGEMRLRPYLDAVCIEDVLGRPHNEPFPAPKIPQRDAIEKAERQAIVDRLREKGFTLKGQ